MNPPFVHKLLLFLVVLASLTPGLVAGIRRIWNRHQQGSGIIMAALLAVLGYFLIKTSLLLFDITPSWLNRFAFVLVPVIPPLFYGYINSLKHNDQHRLSLFGIHGLFPALHAMYWLPFVIMYFDTNHVFETAPTLLFNHEAATVSRILHVVQHLVYLIAIWRIGNPVNQQIIQGFKSIFYLYAALFLGGALVYAGIGFGLPIFVLYTFFALLIYASGFMGQQLSALKGKDRFADQQKQTLRQVNRSVYNKVEIAMEDQKLFRQHGLTLKEFSVQIGLPMNDVSAAVNTFAGTNFSNFVNDHRVNEAKAKLADPASSHLKLLAIASDCGFGNEVSFYKHFKRCTGVTPRAYQSQKNG